MKAAKILRTVSDVVDHFGGLRPTADWAGVGVSAVCNWVSRGYIPPGWHFRMSQHFADRNLILAGSVFGQSDERPRPRPDLSSAA